MYLSKGIPSCKRKMGESMTPKQEADLYEMTHLDYDYPYGSDMDGALSNQDEIELHNRNFAECLKEMN